MNDKPRVTMTPDELAIELLTTGQSMTGGRAEAERLLKQIKDRRAHELAEQIWAYKRPEKPACRTTQHCAYHGWCHRCDPERSGMDRAARLINPERQR